MQLIFLFILHLLISLNSLIRSRRFLFYSKVLEVFHLGNVLPANMSFIFSFPIFVLFISFSNHISLGRIPSTIFWVMSGHHHLLPSFSLNTVSPLSPQNQLPGFCRCFFKIRDLPSTPIFLSSYHEDELNFVKSLFCTIDMITWFSSLAWLVDYTEF